MQKYLFLIIALSSISFVSCGDRQVAVLLDSAQELYDSEQYEAVDSVLQTIDAATLQSGSKQQARYALLYTKTLYKNYIVSPSDSLINIVVDYAETKGDDADRFYAYLYQGIVRYELGDCSKATQSLLRAMANSDDVEDHYSKGQMYTYLSLLNGEFNCSDEYHYAEKAYQEYTRRGLTSYAINAMAMMALAELRSNDIESCRILLDSCLSQSAILEQDFLFDDILSTKANYYLLVDSIDSAENIYQYLLSKDSFEANSFVLMNLTMLYSEKGNIDIANNYLKCLENKTKQGSDRIHYYTAAFRLYRKDHNLEQAINFEDSLLKYIGDEYEKAIQHSSNAYQRDYIEWKLSLAEERDSRKIIIILGLISIIVLLVCTFILFYRKNQLKMQLQHEKCAALQIELKRRSDNIADSIQKLKTTESIIQLHNIAKGKEIAKINWNEITIVFQEQLPFFEKSLMKLYPLSEVEWKVCMLIKLGFKPSEMAILLNHTSNGISNIRSRLYRKVFCQKGAPSDWDSFIEKL